jgi:predicted RNA-binding Zn-ribbon protein involved in translation (DUF1610 family)
MTPIGYAMIGHPFCVPCVDSDFDRAPDGAAYARDGQPVADDVTPIHAGDPDDGAPCAGCGLPLAAPPEARVVWTCPECGSADLRAFYSERRTCRVGARDDTGDPADAAPWPTYESDDFVDIDPALFAFACDACHTHGITPHKGGDTHALGRDQAA